MTERGQPFRSDFDPDYVGALSARRLSGGGALYAAGPGAPRIVFVHGGYHGAWCFGAWMRSLSVQGIGSAALDLPGHGALSREGLAPAMGMDAYADVVVEALAVLGTQPVLLGHSLGGLIVALAATRTHTGPLVLACPSPPGNLPGAHPVPAVPEDRPVAPPSREVAVERFLGGEPVPWAEDFHSRLCPESAALLNDRYLLRVGVEPSRLPPRILVIEAGRDCPVRHPPGQDRAIAAFYRADYRFLPDAGHCLMTGPWAANALAGILEWVRLPGAPLLEETMHTRARNTP